MQQYPQQLRLAHTFVRVPVLPVDDVLRTKGEGVMRVQVGFLY